MGARRLTIGALSPSIIKGCNQAAAKWLAHKVCDRPPIGIQNAHTHASAAHTMHRRGAFLARHLHEAARAHTQCSIAKYQKPFLCMRAQEVHIAAKATLTRMEGNGLDSTPAMGDGPPGCYVKTVPCTCCLSSCLALACQMQCGSGRQRGDRQSVCSNRPAGLVRSAGAATARPLGTRALTPAPLQPAHRRQISQVCRAKGSDHKSPACKTYAYISTGKNVCTQPCG